MRLYKQIGFDNRRYEEMFDFYIGQVLTKMGVFEGSMFGFLAGKLLILQQGIGILFLSFDSGRFDAISDEIMNLDIKVGDQAIQIKEYGNCRQCFNLFILPSKVYIK